MKYLLPILAILQPTTASWWERGFSSIGEALPGRAHLDDSLYDAWAAGLANPNATRSIKVKPYERSTNDAEIRDIEFTWRVNVTEFAVPRNVGLSSNFRNITDPHYVSTAHDVSWSTGGEINSTLANPDERFCLTGIPDYLIFPANVTNLYTEDDSDSTSCEPVLGRDCINAIIAASPDSGSGRCHVPQPSWHLLPECRDTIGYEHNAMEFGSSTNLVGGTFNMNDYATVENNTGVLPPRMSGDAFWGTAYGVMSPEDAARQAWVVERNLHVFLLQMFLPDTRNDSRPAMVSEMICMRINTEQLSASSLLQTHWAMLLAMAVTTSVLLWN